MARKARSLNGKTLRKFGEVELDGGIIIPIRNLSISENSAIRYESNSKIPKKTRVATMEEREMIAQVDPSMKNTKTIPMIREYDVESDEFKDIAEKRERMETIISIVKYIDLDAEVEEGVTLWQDIGVKKGDWSGAADYFSDVLYLTEKDVNKIFREVKILQGESVLKTLNTLEKLSGRSMFEILRLLESAEKMELIEGMDDGEVSIKSEGE